MLGILLCGLGALMALEAGWFVRSSSWWGVMKTLSNSALIWICQILEERFGHAFSLSYEDGRLKLVLCGDSSKAIFFSVPQADFLSADADLSVTHWDCAAEGWESALGRALPAPGASGLPFPLVEIGQAGAVINYDLPGLCYWMLSRLEEIGNFERDVHGRFPATASHAHRFNYLERPVVDEWLCVLRQVIGRVWPWLVLKKNAFGISISHDVDTPSMYGFKSWRAIGRMMAGDLLKRRDISALLRGARVRIGTRSSLHPVDPFNTFDWIMDHASSEGLSNAFYFICGRTDSSRDADYEPEHPAIRQLMRRIHDRGHEIGLHPSYASYLAPALIEAEAKRLRQVAAEEGIVQSRWGGRMHYLRWSQPATLRAWADAGLNYDSTLGYADRPGFRCGTCFEYPAFDPIASEILPLRIRPLVVMEDTIISSMYLGLGVGEQARQKFNNLKSACAAVGGCFTLLWHNSSLNSQALRELYSDIVAHGPSYRYTAVT